MFIILKYIVIFEIKYINYSQLNFFPLGHHSMFHMQLHPYDFGGFHHPRNQLNNFHDINLGIYNNNGYYQTYKIALCGTNYLKITERIKKLEPNQISLALDNDPAGQLATKIIYNELSKIYPTKIINYPKKDPNEFLTSLIISKK